MAARVAVVALAVVAAVAVVRFGLARSRALFFAPTHAVSPPRPSALGAPAVWAAPPSPRADLAQIHARAPDPGAVERLRPEDLGRRSIHATGAAQDLSWPAYVAAMSRTADGEKLARPKRKGLKRALKLLRKTAEAVRWSRDDSPAEKDASPILDSHVELSSESEDEVSPDPLSFVETLTQDAHRLRPRGDFDWRAFYAQRLPRRAIGAVLDGAARDEVSVDGLRAAAATADDVAQSQLTILAWYRTSAALLESFVENSFTTVSGDRAVEASSLRRILQTYPDDLSAVLAAVLRPRFAVRTRALEHVSVLRVRKDDAVTLEDFVALLCVPFTDSEVFAAFLACDRGDGILSVDDLLQTWRAFRGKNGEELGKNEIALIVAEAMSDGDKDGDQCMDFFEFKALMDIRAQMPDTFWKYLYDETTGLYGFAAEEESDRQTLRNAASIFPQLLRVGLQGVRRWRNAPVTALDFAVQIGMLAAVKDEERAAELANKRVRAPFASKRIGEIGLKYGRFADGIYNWAEAADVERAMPGAKCVFFRQDSRRQEPASAVIRLGDEVIVVVRGTTKLQEALGWLTPDFVRFCSPGMDVDRGTGFPKSWGAPPRNRAGNEELPGGYGKGSAELQAWVRSKFGEGKGDMDGYFAHADFAYSTLSVVRDVQEVVEAELKAGARRLTFTGHSMGGAVAQLLGVYWDWAVTKPKAKMQVVSFGSPPTMSPALAKRANKFINAFVNSFDIVPRASYDAARRLLMELARYDFGKNTVRKRLRFARWGAGLIESSAGVVIKGARATRGAINLLRRRKLRCNTTEPVCEAVKQSEGSPPEYFVGLGDDIWDRIETRYNTVGELVGLDFYYIQSAAHGTAIITREKAEKLRDIELTQWGMVSNHLMGPGSTGVTQTYSETNDFLTPAYAELSNDNTRAEAAGRGIINRYMDNLERVAKTPWYWPYVRLAEARTPQLATADAPAASAEEVTAEALAGSSARTPRSILGKLRLWLFSRKSDESSPRAQFPAWWKFWAVKESAGEVRRRWWKLLRARSERAATKERRWAFFESRRDPRNREGRRGVKQGTRDRLRELFRPKAQAKERGWAFWRRGRPAPAAGKAPAVARWWGRLRSGAVNEPERGGPRWWAFWASGSALAAWAFRRPTAGTRAGESSRWRRVRRWFTRPAGAEIEDVAPTAPARRRWRNGFGLLRPRGTPELAAPAAEGEGGTYDLEFIPEHKGADSAPRWFGRRAQRWLGRVRPGELAPPDAVHPDGPGDEARRRRWWSWKRHQPAPPPPPPPPPEGHVVALPPTPLNADRHGFESVVPDIL